MIVLWIVKIFVILFVVSMFRCTVCEHSKFYFEKIFDQTVVNDIEEAEVESEILDLLGLPESPKQNWTQDSLRQSAPNFLLKMYERLKIEEFMDNELHVRKRRFAEYDDRDMLISPLDELELQDSDNIMTFMCGHPPLHNNLVFRNNLENIMWFNTSGIPSDVSLIVGQLKMYKHRSKQRNLRYEIAVYTMDIQGKHDVTLKLLSSVQTMSEYEGWIQLNVTRALSKWHTMPKSNKGFYIEASILGGFGGMSKKEIPISRTKLANMKSDDNKKPFMVGYFKNSKETSFMKSRYVRRRRRQNLSIGERLIKAEQPRNHRSCQKLNFSVDFKKLNWLSWIVAPEKFDSYFCSGDCSFPLNDMDTTNHAIIQTLAHLKNPDLPKPCCAPTALTHIVIIYHVSKDLVNMKKYNNMVVKSCGCL